MARLVQTQWEGLPCPAEEHRRYCEGTQSLGWSEADRWHQPHLYEAPCRGHEAAWGTEGLGSRLGKKTVLGSALQGHPGLGQGWEGVQVPGSPGDVVPTGLGCVVHKDHT